MHPLSSISITMKKNEEWKSIICKRYKYVMYFDYKCHVLSILFYTTKFSIYHLRVWNTNTWNDHIYISTSFHRANLKFHYIHFTERSGKFPKALTVLVFEKLITHFIFYSTFWRTEKQDKSLYDNRIHSDMCFYKWGTRLHN